MQGIGDGIRCYLPIINCQKYDNSGNCVYCKEYKYLKTMNVKLL